MNMIGQVIQREFFCVKYIRVCRVSYVEHSSHLSHIDTRVVCVEKKYVMVVLNV